MQQYVYVVFSSTPYRVGKTIRVLTGQQYNHVSIALDAELTQMYSFARRYYRTPFYGGFVKESLSRYHINGNSARVSICRIPVTPQQHSQLTARMRHMLSHQDIFLYNHISVLGTLFRKAVKIKGAYTCVEFCVLILSKLGIENLDPNHYYSLKTLETLLSPYTVYQGQMPLGATFDAAFYAKYPVSMPTHKTLRDLLRLIPRINA